MNDNRFLKFVVFVGLITLGLILLALRVADAAAVDSYDQHNSTPAADDVLYMLDMSQASGDRSANIRVDYLLSRNRMIQTWIAPDAYSTTGKASEYPLTTNGSLGNVTQPDYPRNVVFTITDADNSLGNLTIVVNGTSAWGNTSTTEYITNSSTLPANGQWNSSIAWAHIASIETWADGAAVADTVNMGYGLKFGVTNSFTTIYKLNCNGTDNATSGLTQNSTHDTVQFPVLPDGGTNYEIWYVPGF